MIFDGVAAILGLRQSIDHEGEAAMALEGLASDPLASPRVHPFTIQPLAGGTLGIGWEALLRGISLRGAQLEDPLDTIVVPIPWKSLHEPREPLNPITAATIGLGHALRLDTSEIGRV